MLFFLVMNLKSDSYLASPAVGYTDREVEARSRAGQVLRGHVVQFVSQGRVARSLGELLGTSLSSVPESWVPSGEKR